MQSITNDLPGGEMETGRSSWDIGVEIGGREINLYDILKRTVGCSDSQ